MMEISYFEASTGDAQDIIEYLKKVCKESEYLAIGDDFDLNVLEEMVFIEKIHQEKNSVMLIARDDTKVVGIATLEGKNNYRYRHRASLGISVLKEYRNQGIGSSLLAGVIGYAIEGKIEIIELEVVTENIAAIRIYEKFGFEQIGLYEDFMKLEDKYYDCYLMNLYL